MSDSDPSSALVPLGRIFPIYERYNGYMIEMENCPPAGATIGPKTLFRLVANSPPRAEDLLTTAEEGKHPDGEPCLRLAVSTFSTFSHADKMRKNVNFFKKHRVATGTIPSDAGKMKRTLRTSGHWSWWPTEGCERHILFSVVS